MSNKNNKKHKEHEKPNKSYYSLPKADYNSIVILWADGWYDWFLCGPIEISGKRYYATCVDDRGHREKGNWYRRYVILELPKEVWDEIIGRHEFFVEKVGDHFVFENGNRKREGLKKDSTWHEFYDRYPTDKYTKISEDYYPIIGWFEV